MRRRRSWGFWRPSSSLQRTPYRPIARQGSLHGVKDGAHGDFQPSQAITHQDSNTLSVSGTEPSQLTESPDDPTVVALVNRVVVSRDPNAFGELYDRFVERVYRYLYFRAGSHPEAEDLTEQVFLKAWEAIGRDRRQGRPFPASPDYLCPNTHTDHI